MDDKTAKIRNGLYHRWFLYLYVVTALGYFVVSTLFI